MASSVLTVNSAHKNRPAFEASAKQDQEDVFSCAAAPLFTFARRIKKMASEMDPLALQNYLAAKIHQMEAQLQNANIRAEKIMLGKYFICCFLDDLIEYEWVHHVGIWRAYRLVFYYFQENNGDERVDVLIERLKQEPSSNLALLELVYMILLYGYQGSCRKELNGYCRSLERIDALYQLLHCQSGDFRKNLLIAL